MSRAKTAAAFLREARLAGRREPSIPEACAPRDEDEAKAVWQALHAMEDRKIVGWKIGATATAAQQAMGLSGPFAGHICEGMVDEGAEIEYRFADLLGPIYEANTASGSPPICRRAPNPTAGRRSKRLSAR